MLMLLLPMGTDLRIPPELEEFPYFGQDFWTQSLSV